LSAIQWTQERYLIVACTVITDVPEAISPCPVASMAKISLPLYPAFAVYTNVDMLSLVNVPCSGFCEMYEPLTPLFLIGNSQLAPDLRSMKPIEFSPQFDSVTNIEQSDAARAKEPDIKLGNPAISARVATLHNHIVATCYAIQPTGRSAGSGGSTQKAREIEGDPAVIYVYIPIKPAACGITNRAKSQVQWQPK
jgi:hypothetical protein